MRDKVFHFICVFLILCLFSFSADDKVGGATEKDITRIMKTVFFYHYNKGVMTEDIMKQTMHNFLVRELDFQRLFWLQSDYDKWMERYELIGKAYGAVIGTGVEWKFIYEIKKEFDARCRVMNELTLQNLESLKEVDKSLEFNEDVEKRGLPKTVEESAEWLKFYLHYNLAYMMQNKKYSFEEAKKKLKEERQRSELKRLKATDFDTVKSFIAAFNNVVDPHTNYFSPRDYQEFNDDMKLSYDGIGARLIRDEISGVTMISDIMDNGPAAKSGLLKKFDEIIGVREENEKIYKDIVGLDLNEVVRNIKGPKQTSVVIKIRRTEDDMVKILEIPIQRGKVETKDEEASITYERIIDGEGKNSYLIGVIYLPSFYRDFDAASRGDKNARSSAKDVETLLLQAQKNKVDGIVLNLQGDSGGSLSDAIRIVGFFIQKGPVVITKNNRGGESVRNDIEDTVVYEGPLVVITNKRSASASEIVAGSLKDYQRALIVGEERTFGKGTVQEVYPLGQTIDKHDLGMLKITVNQFFTAGGDSTQWNGVASDIILPSYYESTEIGEKEYPSALHFEKIRSYIDLDNAKSKWTPITEENKQTLLLRSQERVKINKEFLKVGEQVRKTLQNKSEQKTLKVASFYKDNDSENMPALDFSIEGLSMVSRAELDLMVKKIQDMNIFPKKNFGIDESPVSYLVTCLNELVTKKDMNEFIPRDVKHASSIQARNLVTEINEMQKKTELTNAEQQNLVSLRKRLLAAYYSEFRGPYQNSLYIKESVQIIADLINIEKSKATVDNRK